MTGPLRLLRTGETGAADNIAFTMAMAELRLEGRIPDTLRLYSYRRSVLIGRCQRLDAVDANTCGRRGLEIARRMTGGGAVYMAPGILAWDLVVSRRRFSSLDGASRAIGNAVVACLEGLGHAARFRPPGDVFVGDKKLSGSAGWFEGDCLMHQGTVLVDGDLAEMAAVLRLDAADLPITTLAAIPKAPVSLDTVATSLEAAFSGLFGGLEPDAASAEEAARARRIREEEDWIRPCRDDFELSA